jgi:formylmethanofuran dehydrogenase subunit E
MKELERNELAGLIVRAAARHGHTCPSLVYGCRLAVILAGVLPADCSPSQVTVRHSSDCLLDGASTVLAERFPGLAPLSQRGHGGCALEAAWPGGKALVAVRPAVREHVDLLKRENPDLGAFRRAGVAYLFSLEDGDFADINP